MPGAILSAFLAFTFITAFTPGPNNILALASGSRYGFKGSLPIVAGICLGLSCVMVICGSASFSISALSERSVAIMKCVGCVYILWLAWKVATARPENEGKGEARSGFMSGFILQFANIKIIIYGLTAFSGFVLPYYDSPGAVAFFMFLLSLIGTLGVLAWAMAGSALRRFLNRHARIANTVMGLMLLGCAVCLLV